MVQEEDKGYFSQNFNIISSAYAAEPCPTPGNRGKLYSIDSISIFSSNDWDSSHPAGTPLNDIVLIDNWIRDGKYDQTIAELELIEEFVDRYFFKFPRPELNNNQKITITMTKSNMETITVTSDEITWFE